MMIDLNIQIDSNVIHGTLQAHIWQNTDSTSR